jgi:hypothetical protein
MQKIDLLLADSLEPLISKLATFGNRFERLATTADQRTLSAQFNAFVGEIIQELSPPERDTHTAPGTQMEYFRRIHGHESLADLLAEIRMDEAAAKREDAHWSGKESFKKTQEDRTETSAAVIAKDKGIER